MEWTKNDIIVRMATPQDAEILLEIYAPYVKNTAITFEYEVPSVEEFAGRIENCLKKYPYLVASKKGKIIGYAYVSPFKSRAAYDWSVETSIYVAEAEKGKGAGRFLYEVLESLLVKQGILNVNACIAYPPTEDRYLTKDSVKFHEALGYELVGRFHACGYKFDRWYDMVWMEKMIGKHVPKQPPVKKIQEIITIK